MADLDELRLSRGQLEEVRRTLEARIREGLERDGLEIRALPSFLRTPDRNVSGSALVIDTGGTNVRAAVVEIAGGRARVTHGPIKRKLAVRDGEKLTGSEFFAAQAALAKEIDPPRGLPVGYCFSYPAENLPSRDSRLIQWTKNIDIPGVEGTLVGAQLLMALREVGLEPLHVRVLNDTVASLLGGALAHAEVEAERCIGLIVGTGTNMAAFFRTEGAPKLPRNFAGPMAVNLESGNFHPPHLCEWDEALDRASDNPGLQRFEKAVSGYYLPFLFERILPGQAGFDPRLGAAQLVDFRDRSLEADAREVAEALLARSADLVAAAIAGAGDVCAPQADIGVLAEGSLIWNDPKYAPRVADTLAGLLGKARGAKLLRTEESNVIGSAAAALEV